MSDENAISILVINPNASLSITAALQPILSDLQRPGLTITFYTAPSSAPISINDATTSVLSAADTFRAIVPLLDPQAPHSAFLVACFSDHPLAGMLREHTSKPVLGIFEASLVQGFALGKPFGIVTTGRYGWDVRRSTEQGISAQELHESPRDTVESKIAEATAEILRKGARTVIMGCAGMEKAVRIGSQGQDIRIIDAVRSGASTTSLSKYARAGSPDFANRSLDFCNAFWGLGDGGVDVLFARMRGATRTMEELRNFWKERASIEEQYAKRLAALAKATLGRDEIGAAFVTRALRLETDKQASSHLLVAQDQDGPGRTDDGIPRKAAAAQTYVPGAYREGVQDQADARIVREQGAGEVRVGCMRINSYTAQSTLMQGKDLEKIQLKLERAQQTVQANERDYANFAHALQDTVQKWEQDWKMFCDSCQDLEEDRLEFMKDNMWAYANAVSTVCVSDDESCEKLRLSLEQLEPEKDMENFVRDYGTGNAIPDPPAFVNYANPDAVPPSSQRASTRPLVFRVRRNGAHRPDCEDDVEGAFGTRGEHEQGGPGGRPARGADEQPEECSWGKRAAKWAVEGTFTAATKQQPQQSAPGGSGSARRDPSAKLSPPPAGQVPARRPDTSTATPRRWSSARTPSKRSPRRARPPRTRSPRHSWYPRTERQLDLERVRAGRGRGLPAVAPGRAQVDQPRRQRRRGAAAAQLQNRRSLMLERPMSMEAGHAGIGAQGRSPSPQPFASVSRSASPAMQPAAPQPSSRNSYGRVPPPPANGAGAGPGHNAGRQGSMSVPQAPVQRPKSPNSVGIALDATGHSQQPMQRRPSYNMGPNGMVPLQGQTQVPYGGASVPMYQQQYAHPPPPQQQIYAAPPPAQYAPPPQQQVYQPQPQGYPQGAGLVQSVQRGPSMNGYYPQGGAMVHPQQQQQQQPPPQQQQIGYRAPSPRAPSPQPPQNANQYPTGAVTDDGRGVLFYVKALYNYQATIEEEFDFQEGDIIAVTATPRTGGGAANCSTRRGGSPGATSSRATLFVCSSLRTRVWIYLASSFVYILHFLELALAPSFFCACFLFTLFVTSFVAAVFSSHLMSSFPAVCCLLTVSAAAPVPRTRPPFCVIRCRVFVPTDLGSLQATSRLGYLSPHAHCLW
ncbi:Cell division control protein 15 [Grifola frondosa]|uniref:Cell division control protein 15 n=1 Tax=Grifola frondosa TaxID=5627 RepID=A0A1C7LYY8_GRIFR|nr:Cell division control protein 15 [Grifola frondosa]